MNFIDTGNTGLVGDIENGNIDDQIESYTKNDTLQLQIDNPKLNYQNFSQFYNTQALSTIEAVETIKDDDKEIKKRYEQFIIYKKKVGKGHDSIKVYLAKDLKEPSKKIVCKVIKNKNKNLSGDYAKNLQREITLNNKLMGDLKLNPCKNVLGAYKVIESKNTKNLYIFMDQCDKDLLSYLEYHKSEMKSNINRQLDFARQISEGIFYLHIQSRIAHRDLKPNNILYVTEKDEKGQTEIILKICDFGYSKDSYLDEFTQQVGCLKYLPPEQLEMKETGNFSGSNTNDLSIQKNPSFGDGSSNSNEAKIFDSISAKGDIWSAGILFYRIFFGKELISRVDQAKSSYLLTGLWKSKEEVGIKNFDNEDTEIKNSFLKKHTEILELVQDLLFNMLRYKWTERYNVQNVKQAIYGIISQVSQLSQKQ